MAELDIEKKKNKKPLLWTLVALVAIVAIIWVIAGDKDDEGYVESTEVVTGSEPWGDDSGTVEGGYILDSEAEEAIDQFVTFTSDLGNIGIDHETSHKGITLLADALASLTEDTQNEVEELRQQANQLLVNPESEEHAKIMRDAFVTSANIIEKQIANNDDTEVMNAAQAVDANVLVTNQKDAIKNFFDKAASTLDNLE